MKKHLFLLAFLMVNFTYSQCTIIGADQILVGERQVYKATAENILCTDCFQWTYLDQKVLLENDFNTNEITLKGAVSGDATFSVEINSGKSKIKCEKSIKILAPTTHLLPIDSENCNIGNIVIKENRLENNKVSFEPEMEEGKFKYLWTVTYRNGDQKTSSEKKAPFDFSSGNVIDKVEIQVKLNRCSKTSSKMYDPNFWHFF